METHKAFQIWKEELELMSKDESVEEDRIVRMAKAYNVIMESFTYYIDTTQRYERLRKLL